MDSRFDGLIISSRVRLARNVAGYAFPGRQTLDSACELLDKIASAFAGTKMADGFRFLRLSGEDETSCLALVEAHLISPDLVRHRERGAAFINKQNTVSIMFGEEDHLRIQSIVPGFGLYTAYGYASKADDEIAKQIDYAFSDEIGYLTACPTNVGTGLRASIMLHLPALTMANQIESISQALGRLGQTVRGFYGEGSQAHGSLYQMSNQVTLGITEQDILINLETTAAQVLERETRARRFIHENNKIELEDRLLRSYGVLVNAGKLTSGEMLSLWSDVRFALSLGIITGTDAGALDELLKLQPANLTKMAGKEMGPQERDVFRAAKVKEMLLPKKQA